MKTQSIASSEIQTNSEIIRVEGLRKIYNEKTIPVYALNGVDLQIQKGEFTAIVGPSGCGKTTLLNIIGGLDNASEGKVILDGQDIRLLKER
ncbi:MAG: ATP-binding cassette domain-containing protein, partial [Bacteroidota bacterium]